VTHEDGDTYVIMYDIFSGFQDEFYYTPIEHAYVTIEEADNNVL